MCSLSKRDQIQIFPERKSDSNPIHHRLGKLLLEHSGKDCYGRICSREELLKGMNEAMLWTGEGGRWAGLAHRKLEHRGVPDPQPSTQTWTLSWKACLGAALWLLCACGSPQYKWDGCLSPAIKPISPWRPCFWRLWPHSMSHTLKCTYGPHSIQIFFFLL